VTTGAAALVAGIAIALEDDAGRVKVWRVVGTAEVTIGAGAAVVVGAVVEEAMGAATEEETAGAPAPDPPRVKSMQDS